MIYRMFAFWMWMWTIAARNHLFFNRSFNPGLTTYSEKPIFKLANKSFGSDWSFSLFAAKDLKSKNMRWVREQRFNLIFKRTGLAIITITIVTCYKLCAMYATINTCKVYSALNKRCLTLAGKKPRSRERRRTWKPQHRWRLGTTFSVNTTTWDG